MSTIASLLVKVGLDASDVGSGVDKVHRSVGGLSSMLNTAVGTAAGFAIATPVISALSSTFDMAKDAVFGMNANLQTSTLQFETLMGDADRAKSHVEGLFEFAKQTPFETEPIIKASRLMQTFGGDALNTKENLTLFGDAAAATSSNIDEVGFWMGRAYSAIQGGQPFGEAAARLQELAILSPAARLQMEKLQASGADATQVWKIMEGDLGRFNGAMEKQAGTWSGLTSSFSDTIAILASTAFKPLFDVTSQGLAALNSFLGQDHIMTLITGFSESMATGLNTVVATITGFVQSGAALFQAFASGFAEDGTIGGAIAGGLAFLSEKFPELAGVLNQIWGPLVGTADLLQGLVDVFILGKEPLGDWGQWLDYLSETLGGELASSIVSTVASFQHFLTAAQAAFAGIFESIGGWQGVWAGVQAVLGAAISFVSERFRFILDTIRQVMPSIQSIVGSVLTIIVGFWRENGASIMATAQLIWNTVKEVISTVAGVIQTIVVTVFSAVAGFLESHGAEIQAALSTAWKIIADIIRTLVAIIQATIIPALRFIGSFIGAHGAEIQTLLGAAWTIISNLVLGALELIQGAIKVVLAVIQGDWEGAWNIIQETVGNILDRVKAIIPAAMDFIRTSLQTGVNFILDAANALGLNITTGIRDGINKGIAWITDAIKNAALGALNEGKRILGISSPSKVMAAEVGLPMSQGVAKGVSQGGASINKAVDDTIIDTINRVSDAVSKGSDALGGLNRFVAPSEAAVEAFASSANLVLGKIMEMGSRYRLNAIQHGQAFADGAAKMVSLVGSAAKDLAAIADFQGVDATKLEVLIGGMSGVIRRVKDLADHFAKEGLAEAASFADSAAKLLGLVGTGIEALEGLTDGSVQGVSEEGLDILVDNMSQVLVDLNFLAKEFADQGLDQAAAFAEHAGKVFQLVSSGIEDLGDLSGDEIGRISEEGLDTLVANMADVLIELSQLAREFADQGIPEAANFAQSASTIYETIGGAIEAFDSLSHYAGVAPERMQLLGRDMDEAARLMIEIAKRADTEGVTAAAVFAASLKTVFEMFKVGVEAMDAIRDYQAIPKDRMGGVLLDFEAALVLMTAIAARADLDGIRIASEFAAYTKEIFEAFKSGIEAMDAIREYQAVPKQRFFEFSQDIDQAIMAMLVIDQQMSVLQYKAEEYERRAKKIAQAIESGNRMLEDINGINILDRGNAIPDLPIPDPANEQNTSGYSSSPGYGYSGTSTDASMSGPGVKKEYNLVVHQYQRQDSEDDLVTLVRMMESASGD